MYEVELSVSNVYFYEENDETVNVCTVLTGRYDNPQDVVSVILSFTDSLLAGIM